ncbi:uncharacterized protein METZ01_LOCUS192160 [marine metagenome]|uniref:Uncharacterized protein n=1 Tax=marine metagenome TaxID=408172 RepID=A0A382DLE5_9ZZZZ
MKKQKPYNILSNKSIMTISFQQIK